MKHIIKKILRFLLLLLKTIKSCIYILLHSRYQPIDCSGEGRTLIVCGNGPSLGEQIDTYPEIFQNNDVLCVNAMCTTEWFHKVKPKYYCIMDPGSIYDPKKLTPYMRQRLCIMWDSFTSVDWDMELIVPRYFAKSKFFHERIQKLKIRIRYINLLSFEGFSFVGDWALRKQLCSIGGQTVVTAAVFFGICKGYKEIYLLGAELNWLKSVVVAEDNTLYFDDSHFYGTENRRMMADEFGKPIHMAEYLGYERRSFQEYEMLEAYSKKRGTKVYNATPNSLVDAFERKQLKWLRSFKVEGEKGE